MDLEYGCIRIKSAFFLFDFRAPVESRPQHLISRLKSRTQLPGPRVKIIRQPKAPDGTKGFQLEHNIVSLQS